MNPYEPPAAADVTAVRRDARSLFVQAAIGAWAASAYWAGMTLLIAWSAAFGSLSPMQALLPMVLIVLYAARGWQIFKGDGRAAQRILYLHGVGGVVAVLQMTSAASIIVALNGVKVAIHVFGAFTAWRAWRAFAEGRAG